MILMISANLISFLINGLGERQEKKFDAHFKKHSAASFFSRSQICFVIVCLVTRDG